MFVIDKSGSMNSQGRLGKRELIATLQSLKPDTRFMVYFFTTSRINAGEDDDGGDPKNVARTLD